MAVTERDLLDAETAVRFGADNPLAIARGLGFIRDRGLWKYSSRSWEHYVERALLEVELPIVNAAIREGEAYRRHISKGGKRDHGARGHDDQLALVEAPEGKRPYVADKLRAACERLQTIELPRGE